MLCWYLCTGLGPLYPYQPKQATSIFRVTSQWRHIRKKGEKPENITKFGFDPKNLRYIRISSHLWQNLSMTKSSWGSKTIFLKYSVGCLCTHLWKTILRRGKVVGIFSLKWAERIRKQYSKAIFGRVSKRSGKKSLGLQQPSLVIDKRKKARSKKSKKHLDLII